MKRRALREGRRGRRTSGLAPTSAGGNDAGPCGWLGRERERERGETKRRWPKREKAEREGPVQSGGEEVTVRPGSGGSVRRADIAPDVDSTAPTYIEGKKTQTTSEF